MSNNLSLSAFPMATRGQGVFFQHENWVICKNSIKEPLASGECRTCKFGQARVDGGTSFNVALLVTKVKPPRGMGRSSPLGKYCLNNKRILEALQQANVSGIVEVFVTVQIPSKAKGNAKIVSVQRRYDGDLQKLLATPGSLNDLEKNLIAFQLVKTITQMHRAGIYHCDLKPANILFLRKEDGMLECAVCDFDHSVIEEEDRTNSSLEAFGTPAYRSPEVHELLIAGKNVTPDIAKVADIWALGHVLAKIFDLKITPDYSNPPPEGMSDYAYIEKTGIDLASFVGKEGSAISTTISSPHIQCIVRMMSYDFKNRPSAEEIFEVFNPSGALNA